MWNWIKDRFQRLTRLGKADFATQAIGLSVTTVNLAVKLARTTLLDWSWSQATFFSVVGATAAGSAIIGARLSNFIYPFFFDRKFFASASSYSDDAEVQEVLDCNINPTFGFVGGQYFVLALATGLLGYIDFELNPGLVFVLLDILDSAVNTAATTLTLLATLRARTALLGQPLRRADLEAATRADGYGTLHDQSVPPAAGVLGVDAATSPSIVVPTLRLSAMRGSFCDRTIPNDLVSADDDRLDLLSRAEPL